MFAMVNFASSALESRVAYVLQCFLCASLYFAMILPVSWCIVFSYDTWPRLPFLFPDEENETSKCVLPY